jgi:phosphoribosyl-AMP cyclohydrolase
MGGAEDKKLLEGGLELMVQFEKRGGSVPVVMVDSSSKEIYAVAYADSASFGLSLSRKEPMLWGPDGSMWTGAGIEIAGILVDCDQDAAVYMCRGCGSPKFAGIGMPGQVKYDEKGLVPAVAQDACTGEVLMLGYANDEALNTAIEKRLATFWSTSRRKLWTKGEESGNMLEIRKTLVQQDGSAVAYVVEMKGDGACHTRHGGAGEGPHRRTCFYRRVAGDGNLEFLEGLE